MKFNVQNATFFEKMYRNKNDPWSFCTNPYELNRYESICNALKHKKYRLIFEPGCSTGVLTEHLALFAHQVQAIDISPTAVAIAKNRCAHLKNISFECKSIIDFCLDKRTDLLLLSEIGYYFDADAWHKIVSDYFNQCARSTTFIVSHWLGKSNDHLMHGNTVHEIVESIPGLSLDYSEHNTHFRLDRLVKQ